jgi:hypothetical protein
MNTINVKDGTQIYYKDWGSGQPACTTHKDVVHEELLAFLKA